jgi:hypothetical protein
MEGAKHDVTADGTAVMTIARFEAPGGPPETQALKCFRQLRDFLDGIGRRVESTSYLTVEVTSMRSLGPVMKARRTVFGDRRPRTVSNRFTRLPPGELVRVTAHLDQPTPESEPTSD